MILFTKGERRYTEAKPSEVLLAAADLLSDLGVSKHAAVLEGMALMAKANGEYAALLEAKRVDSQKREDQALSRIKDVQ